MSSNCTCGMRLRFTKGVDGRFKRYFPRKKMPDYMYVGIEKNIQNRIILILNPVTKEQWIYKRFFEDKGVEA